jgi:hypothetical protein
MQHGLYGLGYHRMLLTLDEAAKLLSPSGRISARSLRTEARKGRLRLVRIAGKDFVTEESVNAMVTAATLTMRPPCHDADCQPDSTCAEVETTAPPSGSFSTERKRLALAQARMTVQQLKRPSKRISPKTTDPRVVPIDRPNSSSQK